MHQLVGFPNPVNEKAARVVAGVAALMAIGLIPDEVCAECANILGT